MQQTTIKVQATFKGNVQSACRDQHWLCVCMLKHTGKLLFYTYPWCCWWQVAAGKWRHSHRCLCTVSLETRWIKHWRKVSVCKYREAAISWFIYQTHIKLDLQSPVKFMYYFYSTVQIKLNWNFYKSTQSCLNFGSQCLRHTVLRENIV